MIVVRLIIMLFNLVFAWVVLFFASKLSWKCKEDRISIVGFASMMLLYIADIVLILL